MTTDLHKRLEKAAENCASTQIADHITERRIKEAYIEGAKYILLNGKEFITDINKFFEEKEMTQKELTWQDISRIEDMLTDVCMDENFADVDLETFYTEVLRRFKEEKK